MSNHKISEPEVSAKESEAAFSSAKASGLTLSKAEQDDLFLNSTVTAPLYKKKEIENKRDKRLSKSAPPENQKDESAHRSRSRENLTISGRKKRKKGTSKIFAEAKKV